VYAQSKGSHQDSLLIEQQTGFYLKHTEQCWEVVEARDQTIDSLRAINKAQKDVTGASKSEARISQRIAISFKDSLQDCRKEVIKVKEEADTQRHKKVNWRKGTLVVSVIAFGEAVIIYLKFMLKW